MIDLTLFDRIPPFDGTAAGDYDCRENCVLRLFTGVGAADYEAYADRFPSAGFSLLCRNDTDGNRFAMFRGDVLVTLHFAPCRGELRVTVSKDLTVPAFTETTCEGDGRTAFFGFENDHTLIDCGMCLMIQCPDRSFFLVDSGHYFQFNDNDRIYRFMRERTPAGQKVVVNGWFITHAHTDHISKLIDFLQYNTDDVIIEGFYQNLLPADYDCGSDNHEEAEMAAKLFKALDEFPAPVYKLHTGMKFYIRNLAFEVLYTHEDLFPTPITDYNDSSSVLTVEAEGSGIFIPGDAAVMASAVLEERYTKALRCDIVQIAHHGHTGLSPRCYEMIGAKTAVFPVTRIMFEGDIVRMEADRRAVELADEYFITGDGTVEIPLPYKKGGTKTYPDETMEDFGKIKRLWRYVYSEEYMDEIYGQFLAHGGDPEKLLLPTSRYGWIEPKPPIDESKTPIEE